MESFCEVTVQPFDHDCDKCQYVGGLSLGGMHIDVYIHRESKRTTVTLRYGDEDHQYWSSSCRDDDKKEAHSTSMSVEIFKSFKNLQGRAEDKTKIDLKLKEVIKR